MTKIDGSIIPVLYVTLMAPLLAISMVFFPLTTVFKGILAISSLAGALGLSAITYQREQKRPMWMNIAAIVAIILLYALSALLFSNLLL